VAYQMAPLLDAPVIETSCGKTDRQTDKRRCKSSPATVIGVSKDHAISSVMLVQLTLN